MFNFSDHKREIFPPLYMYNKSVLIVACDFQILRIYRAINYLYCLLKFILFFSAGAYSLNSHEQIYLQIHLKSIFHEQY